MKYGTLIAVRKSMTSNRVLQYRVKTFGKKPTEGVVHDLSEQQILEILKTDEFGIVNLGYENNKIKFINGADNRYTDLNQLDDRAKPLVVIAKYKIEITNGLEVYELSDYMGEAILTDTNTTINLLRKYGIANGKLVDKEGKTIISSIRGEFPCRKLTDSGERAVLANLATTNNYGRPETTEVSDQEELDNRIEELAAEQALENDRAHYFDKQLQKLTKQNHIVNAIGLTSKLQVMDSETLKPFIDGVIDKLIEKGIPFDIKEMEIEPLVKVKQLVQTVEFVIKLPIQLSQSSEEKRPIRLGLYGFEVTNEKNEIEGIQLFTFMAAPTTIESLGEVVVTRVNIPNIEISYMQSDFDNLYSQIRKYGELTAELYASKSNEKEAIKNRRKAGVKRQKLLQIDNKSGKVSWLKTIFGMKKEDKA